MEAKELIKENNQKRKQLSRENLNYYEDMLVYIRLSFSKSEQETEEVLSELLDHLLMSQEEGRTAEEIFGDDPKKFVNEIIGGLPTIMTKKRIRLFIMGALYFLAASTFFLGIINLIFYFFQDNGNLTEKYYVGTVLVRGMIFIPIAFFLLYLLIYYLQWSCFKKINKFKEFFIFWIYGLISVGMFMVVIYIIPEMGPVVMLPVYGLCIIGVVFYIAGRLTRTSF